MYFPRVTQALHLLAPSGYTIHGCAGPHPAHPAHPQAQAREVKDMAGSGVEELQRLYKEHKYLFPVDPESIKVYKKETGDKTAGQIAEDIEASIEVEHKLPRRPFYTYPFYEADNVLEYVLYKDMQEEYYVFKNICKKIKECTFEEEKFIVKLVASYLGYKYAIIVTEGACGLHDQVLFTNDPRTPELMRRLGGVEE